MKTDHKKLAGRLYAVGVGPGDPEFLTLKAARILRQVSAIAVPRGCEEGTSLALEIIGKAVDLTGKTILKIHFPMIKNITAEALKPAAIPVFEMLQKGQDVAFVTLGDPTIYSTFFRLRQALALLGPAVFPTVEIVPGVTSVTAAAARAGRELVLSGQRLAVLPAAYHDELRDVFERFETVCLMKAGSAFPKIKKLLGEMGLMENAVCVCRTGMQGEMVKPVGEIESGELDYFSTIIVTGIKRGKKG